MAPYTLPTTEQWSTGPLPRPRRTFFHQKKEPCKQNSGKRFWVNAFYTQFFLFLFLAKCRPNYRFENVAASVQHPISGSNSTHPSWGSSRRIWELDGSWKGWRNLSWWMGPSFFIRRYPVAAPLALTESWLGLSSLADCGPGQDSTFWMASVSWGEEPLSSQSTTVSSSTLIMCHSHGGASSQSGYHWKPLHL